MFVLFLRHGESVDDLTDQYGGWGDFPLTPRGEQQIRDQITHIKTLSVKFDRVYTSPLSRAAESARIIGNALSLPVEKNPYLKEKNGYGLLTGLNKDSAKSHYPELVKKLEEQETVPGAESQKAFITRVKHMLELFSSLKETGIIAVTHGGVMKALFHELFSKEIKKSGDGGFALVEFTRGDYNGANLVGSKDIIF